MPARSDKKHTVQYALRCAPGAAACKPEPKENTANVAQATTDARDRRVRRPPANDAMHRPMHVYISVRHAVSTGREGRALPRWRGAECSRARNTVQEARARKAPRTDSHASVQTPRFARPTRHVGSTRIAPSGSPKKTKRLGIPNCCRSLQCAILHCITAH